MNIDSLCANICHPRVLLFRARSQVHVSGRGIRRVADTPARNASRVRRQVESTHSARCRSYCPQRSAYLRICSLYPTGRKCMLRLIYAVLTQ